MIAVGWNVVLKQGLQLLQRAELRTTGNGQQVRFNGGRVSQEDLHAIFAGFLVLRQFKQSGDSIVGELWVPNVECGEDICDCRVVAGEQHNFRLKFVGNFLFPVVDRLLDEHAALESLQLGVVGTVNVAQVGQALKLLGEVILGPIREFQAELFLLNIKFYCIADGNKKILNTKT